MRLSTKGRYGVRLMLELALRYGNGPLDKQMPVYLKDIADKQGISEKYLWHLISLLKSAGLINSIRGAKGGYILAKEPLKISLKDIVCALEGSLYPVECLDSKLACPRESVCVSRDVWREIGEKILQTLNDISLADMVDRYNNKTRKQEIPAYQI